MTLNGVRTVNCVTSPNVGGIYRGGGGNFVTVVEVRFILSATNT